MHKLTELYQVRNSEHCKHFHFKYIFDHQAISETLIGATKIVDLETNNSFYLKTYDLLDTYEKKLYETESGAYKLLLSSSININCIPEMKTIKPIKELEGKLGYILTSEVEIIESKRELLNLISTKKVNITLKNSDTEDDKKSKLKEYFVKKAVKGIKDIHKSHVIHNDLKSSHILISKDARIIFIDFNYSILLDGKTVPPIYILSWQF